MLSITVTVIFFFCLVQVHGQRAIVTDFFDTKGNLDAATESVVPLEITESLQADLDTASVTSPTFEPTQSPTESPTESDDGYGWVPRIAFSVSQVSVLQRSLLRLRRMTNYLCRYWEA
jgi:hypothetical protein